MWSCGDVPPHVIVTVEDPYDVAADATSLGYGRSLGDLHPIDLDDHGFPLTFLLTTEEDETVEVWVEARDKGKRAQARGHIEVALAVGTTSTATITLTAVCEAGHEDGTICLLPDDAEGLCLAGACVSSSCGDGIVVAPEECDDGNQDDTDECPTSCRPASCGDGFLCESCGEQCDDGNMTNTDACLGTCVPNVCGDGHVRDGVEDCDDNNATDGDGCDHNCTNTGCGNGVRTSGEQCDDGNTVTEMCPYNGGDCTVCNATCLTGPGVPSFCGDSVIDPFNETCDDGGLNGTISTGHTYCTDNCKGTQRCGNDVREGTEICDDGNDNDSGEGLCLSTCAGYQSCGDGDINGDETCDGDDGVYCNGVESCDPVLGCVAGVPCDDGLYCTGPDSCNEETDECTRGTSPCPDDGTYCNGLGSCDEDGDECISGDDPCDDGLYCTGWATCDEDGGECISGDDPCDNGLYCDGEETCDDVTDGCDSGTPPCPADDDIYCNGPETCDEDGDECISAHDPCNDGLYCTGWAACNEDTEDCTPGTPPCGGDGCACTPDYCSEGTVQCVHEWATCAMSITNDGPQPANTDIVVTVDLACAGQDGYLSCETPGGPLPLDSSGGGAYLFTVSSATVQTIEVTCVWDNVEIVRGGGTTVTFE